MFTKTQKILLQLGIMPNLVGFDYICKAVEIVRANKRIKVTHLYDEIAKELNTNASSVERSIRFAMSKVAHEKWKEFGAFCKTNSEFIHTICLKLDMEELAHEQN